MKHILIVGKSFSNAEKYCDEHGYQYSVLLDQTKITKKKREKYGDKLYPCDFTNDDTIRESLKNVPKPDGVFVIYENYISQAAFVARYFGLPGLSEESARACSDKYFMRSLFATAPKQISPAFAEVHNWEEVKAFADAHHYPLMLKPANLSKSLLITKSVDEAELKANYDKMMEHIDAIYAKYASNSTPKVIIEEYLDGRVHSVDAFVDADGTPHVLEQIVDYQTGYEVGYADNFHYSRIMPSKLTPEEKADLTECAELGCRALKMTSSPAHIEIIMTKHGARIVEIGARNGGYRERMYGMANGIDITGNAMKLACGEPVNITAERNDPIAVLELFPMEPGVYDGIQNEEDLKQLPSLKYMSIKAKPDAFIGKSSDGYKAALIVILHNEDAEQFNKDLEYVNTQVRVLTK